VIPLLEAKGLHVVAVQNPLTSLADDVAATQRAIDVQKGPVILVGHSWGGTVIVKNEIDPAFNNDQYNLLFAFHIVWDTSATVQDRGQRDLEQRLGE
jgi:hypothetical protein